MSGQDLFEERDQIKKGIESSLLKLHQNGKTAAEATMNYRIALAQKILQLKAEGTPVSIIDKLAKGDETVASLELDMNIAEVQYKASNEKIMAQKKLLESIEADIKREYYRGE